MFHSHFAAISQLFHSPWTALSQSFNNLFHSSFHTISHFEFFVSQSFRIVREIIWNVMKWYETKVWNDPIFGLFDGCPSSSIRIDWILDRGAALRMTKAGRLEGAATPPHKSGANRLKVLYRLREAARPAPNIQKAAFLFRRLLRRPGPPVQACSGCHSYW